MTDELAVLPEDVRVKVAWLDTGIMSARWLTDSARTAWRLVVSELVRLARENADYHEKLGDALGRETRERLRAERAAAELAESRKHANTMFLDARDWAVRYGEMEARTERVEAELNAVGIAIGTTRFMDPPDGGDVSLSEQVRRMSDELAALKRRIAEAAVGTLELCYNGHEPSFIGFDKPFKVGSTPQLGREYALLPVGGETK